MYRTNIAIFRHIIYPKIQMPLVTAPFVVALPLAPCRLSNSGPIERVVRVSGQPKSLGHG